MAVTRSQRVKGGLWGSGQSVHPLQQIAIQPAPIPSNPHLAAPRYEAGGNLTKLAQSLRSFNQSLNNLANTNAAIKSDPNSRDNQAYAAKLQQMSLEELKREAQNNSHGGVRIRETILNRLLADKAAAGFKLQWLDDYHNEFDKTGGNLDEFFEAKRGQMAQALPSDIARGMFYQLTEGVKLRSQEADTQTKIDYTLQQLGSALTDNFRNTIEDATSQGKTAGEAADLVFSNAASLADFMSLSPQERDKSIFALAQEYALQGNEAMVRALLEAERGRLGGALVKDSAWSTKSLALINQAGSIFRQQKQEQALPALLDFNRMRDAGELTAENAQKFIDEHGLNPALVANAVTISTMVRQENLKDQEKYEQQQIARDNHNAALDLVLANNLGLLTHAGSVALMQPQQIPDPKGFDIITLSVEQQLQDATAEMEQQWSDQASGLLEQGMSEADVQAALFTQRMAWYGMHNIKHEGWAATLNSIAVQAPLEMLIKDDATLQYAKGAAQLMRDIKAKNPGYYESLMSDKASAKFWKAYELAKEREGLSDEAALRGAARLMGEPLSDKIKRSPDKQEYDTIMDQVRAGLRDFDAAIPENEKVIQNIVQDLIDAGSPTDSLATHALRQIKGSHFIHHGVLTRLNADAPQDTLSLLDTIIDRRFSEFKDRYGLPSAEDLYLKPDPTGTSWTVHSKQYLGIEIGQPVTLADLPAIREEQQKAQAERIKPVIEQFSKDLAVAQAPKTSKRYGSLGGGKPALDLTKLFTPDRNAQRDTILRRLNHYRKQLESVEQPAPQKRNPERLKKTHSFLENAIMNAKISLARLDVEGLLEQGLTPKSKQWQDWQSSHGLEVSSAVERQLFGTTPLLNNQQYKP